ncbi:MAG: hydroxyphenylacetyl-CoA thioesterase PaaI [Woeseia sp.]
MNNNTEADSMSDDTAKALANACAKHMFACDPATQGLGIEIAAVQPGYAEARMTVREDMLNGHGSCHGGFIFTLADSAFAFACNTYNNITVASGASMEFLAPAYLGDRLLACAKEQVRGRRRGVYDVEVGTEDGRKIGLFRGHSHARNEPLLPDRD